MRRSSTLIAMLLLVPGLAACGSSKKETGATDTGTNSDAAQIRSVVADYTAAVYAQDGPKACAKLTADLQRNFVDAVAQQDASVRGKPCSYVLGLVLKRSSSQLQNAKPLVDSLKLTKLAVHGDSATMVGVFSAKGQTLRTPYQARRVSGRWLLQCCVGTPKG